LKTKTNTVGFETKT